jgi:leucine efflux protein
MVPMLGITNIWTYVIGTLLIVLLPGPNSMFVLSTAARRGVRIGYRAACGVFIGDAVIMILSASGVAALLQAEPVLFDIVKYAGAGYLCYIGYGLLRGAWKRHNEPSTPSIEVPATALVAERNPFRRALGISLLNPKAILFFVSFFIQFVSPSYAYPALSFLILGTIAEVFSFVYLTTLIFAGSYLAAQFQARRKLARGLTTGVAAVFIGFAVRLATASMS